MFIGSAMLQPNIFMIYNKKLLKCEAKKFSVYEYFQSGA